MRNKIYDKKGFRIYEVLEQSIPINHFNSDPHWRYYVVETPDLHVFRFDYFKDAEKFATDLILAYQPYSLSSREGMDEFIKDLKEVRHYISDLYRKGYVGNHDHSPLTYRQVAQIQRVMQTLVNNCYLFDHLELERLPEEYE